MEAAERSIAEILLVNGYGHTPERARRGPTGAHHVFSFNTMEVVATVRAHEALAVLGIEA
jgi:hypothetical protein